MHTPSFSSLAVVVFSSLSVITPASAAVIPPTNSGYSIGFGPGFDPTTNEQGSSATVSIVNNQPYCQSGNWCKQIVFPASGGTHQITIPHIPIRGPAPGKPASGTTFDIKTNTRKLYQVNDCSTITGVQFYYANGTAGLATNQGEFQSVPWGTYATNQFLTGAQGYARVDTFVKVVCNGQSDTSKLPTVFLDNLSMTLV